jgi:hypothetical protein
MTHPRSRSAVSAQLDEWLSRLFDRSVIWVSSGYASVIARLDPSDSEHAPARLRVERSLKALAQKLTR